MSRACLCGQNGEITRIALVCGGKWHDFQFARLQLLTMFSEHDLARVSVYEHYPAELDDVDVLVTYTCGLVPSQSEQQQFVDFVTHGGRWLALHATNSAIEPAPTGSDFRWITPRSFGRVAEVLGSQFLGHPRIEPYLVEVAQPEHPLVSGLENFTVTDELYVSELNASIDPILGTHFQGTSPGFEEGDSPERVFHPVLYERSTGDGTVVYFTLGHCRGRFDVQDLGIDDLGAIDRGSWESDAYRTIMQRTISWAVHGNYDFAHPHTPTEDVAHDTVI